MLWFQASARISASADRCRIRIHCVFSQGETASEVLRTDDVQQETKIEKSAADLYWLGFLLTGQCDTSIEIAADAAASDDDHANPFFADWMGGWHRRLVIGKALAAIHNELATSAGRTERAPFNGSTLPPRNWSISPDTTKADLERALLDIDLFPRAALLLLVFEGVRIADAATLLDASPDLLKKAQAIALRELTANLAGTRADVRAAQPPWKFSCAAN